MNPKDTPLLFSSFATYLQKGMDFRLPVDCHRKWAANHSFLHSWQVTTITTKFKGFAHIWFLGAWRAGDMKFVQLDPV